MTILPRSREVYVEGQRVELTRKVYDLLLVLASDPGRVFTKDELLERVWAFPEGSRPSATTRTLDSHASRLRKRLNIGADRFVGNVWGVGYRLFDSPSVTFVQQPGAD